MMKRPKTPGRGRTVQIKIADGSLVEVTAGSSKVMLTSDAFGAGLGPFLVVGFEGDLPVIRIVEGATPEESKDAPVDGGLIASVDNPDAPKVEVKLPSGEVVLVDAAVAPILEAFIATNTALIDQLAKLLSGEEVKQLKLQIESLTVERDVAVASLASARGALPVLEEAMAGLQKAIEALKG